MKTIIYLVRHTQTVGNVERRLTGRYDYEVTTQGEEYINMLTQKLRNIKFDAIYASTSKRTSKTIQKLADLNNVSIKEVEELCEMYFGIYDGMTWEEVNKRNPEIDRLHKETNEIMTIPEQESTAEVVERMNKIMFKIATENIGKNILICSHGVAIEAFLRTITKEPFTEQRLEYSQKNTSVNVIKYDNENDNFEVILLNDTSHLNNIKEFYYREV